ncbi:MAG: molybdenum cofactor biosynthesis protein MoaB [Planctomycetes bacterium]|nr:molybdenum cofactor biosynthesis protein MoaB [Planctomycetota bacterium]
MSITEHKEHAKDLGHVRYALVTTSDTRTLATDQSGKAAQEMLGGAGHACVAHELVPNDAARIRATVEGLLAREVELVLVSGGTGISRKDVTIETLRPLIEREIDGFGELFRTLSREEIGTAAILSRAFLGVARGKLLACVPGSTGAMRLALGRILLPELGHMVHELTK